ncbi:antA/AntB antirepressor family protein [Corynebacterium striatum]
MNELIPLADNNGVQAVTGRDLHAFLEVRDNYTDWMKRMIAYGFSAGQDFSEISDKPKGAGRPRIDHIMSLDMAKEISMIQRTDKGKQARQYFIECERRVKSSVPAIPQTYAEALRAAADNAERAEVEARNAAEQRQLAEKRQRALEAQAPAVAKAAAHSASEEWKGRQEFAREVQAWGRNWGYTIIQESVHELLRRKKMLISGHRRDRNHATAQAEKNGWAKTAKGVSDITGKPWAAARISPKGQDIAWKWINEAVEMYGQELNPKEAA